MTELSLLPTLSLLFAIPIEAEVCAITRFAAGYAFNFFFDRLCPNRRDDFFSPIHHIRFYFIPTFLQPST